MEAGYRQRVKLDELIGSISLIKLWPNFTMQVFSVDQIKKRTQSKDTIYFHCNLYTNRWLPHSCYPQSFSVFVILKGSLQQLHSWVQNQASDSSFHCSGLNKHIFRKAFIAFNFFKSTFICLYCIILWLPELPGGLWLEFPDASIFGTKLRAASPVSSLWMNFSLCRRLWQLKLRNIWMIFFSSLLFFFFKPVICT